MGPSFSSAGTEAEKAGYGERITVSGTEIGGCGVEFLEFYVGCLIRACKWFN
jgi:hypothetical protein